MTFFRKTGRGFLCRLKIIYLNSQKDSLYKFVVCKECKGCIRLPKNKGKLIVSCPKCGNVSEVETDL